MGLYFDNLRVWFCLSYPSSCSALHF